MKVLQALLVLVLERYYRLRRCLEETQRFASPPERQLAALLEERIGRAEGRAAELAARLGEPASPAAGDGYGRHLDSLRELAEEAGRLSGSLRFLPGPAVHPQTYVFLRSLFGGDFWDATVIALADGMEGRCWGAECGVPLWCGKVRVVCLPRTERTGPLAWALLAREYGRCLVCDAGGATVVSVNSGEVEPAVREMCADLVAQHVLGPAYFAALAFSMTAGVMSGRGGGEDSLPPAVRLEVMKTCLVERNLWDRTLELCCDCLVSACGLRDRDGLPGKWEEERRACLEVLPRLKDKLSGLPLPAFERENLANAWLLVERLRDGIPVGARRKHPSPGPPGRAGGDGVYAMLRQVEEEPSGTAEIVCAGWLHRLAFLWDELGTAAVDAVREGRPVAGAVYEGLSYYDDLILKSLQTASVHRYYLEGLKESG